MPSSGRLASRVAKPRNISDEQESSKVALITAAISGGGSGTMYSSPNSAMVIRQPATLVIP
ncbi:MAG: hypothetical protein WA417_22300 [Stellaceae bacterium]